jgi:hypothetical protein
VTTRTLTATAALAVSTALLLTACGAHHDTATTAKPPAPHATAPSGASAATPRPAITFPPGAKNVFENQHTGDPKKDAVLADNEQAVEAVYDAILVGNPKLPALNFYETGDALASAGTFIQGYLNKGITWAGSIRYFDRKASFNDDGSASVVYCADESHAYPKNRKTGKADHSPTTSDSYVLYNSRLRQSPQGVWQTTEVISQRGASQCQP